MLKYKIDKELMEGTSIRVRPRILEQAIGFFLENHMMEDMVHGGEIIRDSRVYKNMRVDLKTEDTCIESKVLLSTWQSKGETGFTRPSDLAALLRYKGTVNMLLKHFKRVILLVILQDGVIGQEEKGCLSARLREAYQEEICRGMEIWIAGLELQDDGIALVDYHNETRVAGTME